MRTLIIVILTAFITLCLASMFSIELPFVPRIDVTMPGSSGEAPAENKTATTPAQPAQPKEPTPTTENITLAEAEKILFKLINDQRVAINRTALIWSDNLSSIARSQCEQMVEIEKAEYQEFDGRQCIAQLVGYSSKEEAVGAAYNSWIQIPKHRTSLLSTSLKYCGIGMAQSGDNTYISYLATTD